MYTDLIPGVGQAKLIAWTVAIAVACAMMVFCGWYINGWRLGREIAVKDTEITRLTGEIEKQNLAYKLLADEATRKQADAKSAQLDAALLRKRLNDRSRELKAKPASSCDEALRQTWGVR